MSVHHKIKYNIKIISKYEWSVGKIDPTEYNNDYKLIHVRSDYDYENDPAGWIEHEKGHADWKGSLDFSEYPDNPIEWQAFGRQFKYLKSKGFDFEGIFEIPTMEHKVQFKDFLRKVWNSVNI